MCDVCVNLSVFKDYMKSKISRKYGIFVFKEIDFQYFCSTIKYEDCVWRIKNISKSIYSAIIPRIFWLHEEHFEQFLHYYRTFYVAVSFSWHFIKLSILISRRKMLIESGNFPIWRYPSFVVPISTLRRNEKFTELKQRYFLRLLKTPTK